MGALCCRAAVLHALVEWSRGCEKKPSQRLADPAGPPHPLQQGVLRQLAALSSPGSLRRGCCGQAAAAALFEMIILYAVTVEYCSIFCNYGLHASNAQ